MSLYRYLTAKSIQDHGLIMAEEYCARVQADPHDYPSWPKKGFVKNDKLIIYGFDRTGSPMAQNQLNADGHPTIGLRMVASIYGREGRKRDYVFLTYFPAEGVYQLHYHPDAGMGHNLPDVPYDLTTADKQVLDTICIRMVEHLMK